MHCTSCALNIDGDLEDTPGIDESRTNYAQSKTIITYDPKKITTEQLIGIIKNTGYDAHIDV